jgi:hypothetical protein
MEPGTAGTSSDDRERRGRSGRVFRNVVLVLDSLRGASRLKELSDGIRSIRGRDIRPRAISAEEVVFPVRGSGRKDIRIGFRSFGDVGRVGEMGDPGISGTVVLVVVVVLIGGTDDVRRDDFLGFCCGVGFVVPFCFREDF